MFISVCINIFDINVLYVMLNCISILKQKLSPLNADYKSVKSDKKLNRVSFV